jgi:hypothetical protein
MKHDIIKTDNYLLIVSDEEIKNVKPYYGKWHYEIGVAINKFPTYLTDLNVCRLIIAHLPLNNSPILEGVDLLPPLEDDVERFSSDYTEEWCGKRRVDVYIHDAFKTGYNKAKEKCKWTNEDMIEYSNWLFKWCEYNKYRKLIDGVKPYGIGEFISDKDMFDKFLKEKSHQQPKYPIGFECEMITMNKGYTEEFDYPYQQCDIPKTTTNSQGQTVLVGKYIYE